MSTPLPPPPDPEQANDARADNAADAIDAYERETGGGVIDLIASLAHWCDRNDQSMRWILRNACLRYDDECGGQGRAFNDVDL